MYAGEYRNFVLNSNINDFAFFVDTDMSSEHCSKFEYFTFVFVYTDMSSELCFNRAEFYWFHCGAHHDYPVMASFRPEAVSYTYPPAS